MGGVGGITSETSHGIYSVKIPLANGDDATMTGVCIDQITETFPYYGEVIKDIQDKYLCSGDVKKLPSVPPQVGGMLIS